MYENNMKTWTQLISNAKPLMKSKMIPLFKIHCSTHQSKNGMKFTKKLTSRSASYLKVQKIAIAC